MCAVWTYVIYYYVHKRTCFPFNCGVLNAIQHHKDSTCISVTLTVLLTVCTYNNFVNANLNMLKWRQKVTRNGTKICSMYSNFCWWSLICTQLCAVFLRYHHLPSLCDCRDLQQYSNLHRTVNDFYSLASATFAIAAVTLHSHWRSSAMTLLYQQEIRSMERVSAQCWTLYSIHHYRNIWV